MTQAELEGGEQVYASTCATCHGAEGDAIPNIDLGSGKFRRAYTDRELVNVIRNGISGTAMAPAQISEREAALVVGYLRWASGVPAPTLPGTTGGLVGNVANGKALYSGKGGCVACHVVQGVGGHLGPDLSGIGSARPSVDLERALTDPNAEVRPDARVARVTASGRDVVGRLLGEDANSLHLRLQDGQQVSFRKSDVRWEVPAASGMSSYAGALTAQEIADIVSYLRTLDAPLAP
jgi:putative heme-binding domain-containing protein